MDTWSLLTSTLCGVFSLFSSNTTVCPFSPAPSGTRHFNQVRPLPIIQETNSFLPVAVQVVNSIVDQTLNSELKQIIYDSFITKELINQQKLEEEEKEEEEAEREEEEEWLSTTPDDGGGNEDDFLGMFPELGPDITSSKPETSSSIRESLSPTLEILLQSTEASSTHPGASSLERNISSSEQNSQPQKQETSPNQAISSTEPETSPNQAVSSTKPETSSSAPDLSITKKVIAATKQDNRLAKQGTLPLSLNTLSPRLEIPTSKQETTSSEPEMSIPRNETSATEQDDRSAKQETSPLPLNTLSPGPEIPTSKQETSPSEPEMSIPKKKPATALNTLSPGPEAPASEPQTPSLKPETPSSRDGNLSRKTETSTTRQGTQSPEQSGNGTAKIERSEPDNLRLLRNQYETHLKQIMISELFDHPESGSRIGEEFSFPSGSGIGKVLAPEMDSLPGSREDPNYWQPDVNRLLDSIKVAEVFRQISPDVLVLAELRDHLISEAIHKRLRPTTGLSSNVISFLYQIDSPDARLETLTILKKILETKDVSEEKTVELTKKVIDLLESPSSKLSKTLEKCSPIRYSA